MTTRNWRAKNTRAGCGTMYFDCYIPSTIAVSSFTEVGSFTWVAPRKITSVEYLVVGGGGGGGGAYDTGSAGGGGAGLVVSGTLSVTPGTTYIITVGDGGEGGTNTDAGAAGLISTFDTITRNIC